MSSLRLSEAPLSHGRAVASVPPDLFHAASMQAVDAAAAAAGVDTFALMQSAGVAVARHVEEVLLIHRSPCVGALSAAALPDVVVVAGPGNNGGDGAVAALVLARAGWQVAVVQLGLPGARESDASRAFEAWHGLREQLPVDAHLTESCGEWLTGAGVIVDALFGAGLNRAPSGAAARLIEAMNRSSAPTVCVDLPSGLDGNAIRAFPAVVSGDYSVTFERYKPAHLIQPTARFCGKLSLHSIGMPVSALQTIAPDAWLNASTLWRDKLPAPGLCDHKYQRGLVLIRGGVMHMAGAARLSAQTALECGAGAVTLACTESTLPINAAHLTAVMLTVVNTVDDWLRACRRLRPHALVLGPGNGNDQSTRDCVLAALTLDIPTVLDADAITAFETCPDRLFAGIRNAAADVVLTPHASEFARVFKTDGGTASRLHQAIEGAQACGAVLILKGHDTVIASPKAQPRVNLNAPPWLATAGAGDVLAGLVAALMAQGMGGFDAASAAVCIHGRAALQLGYPMTAERLVPACATELGRLSATPYSAPVDAG